MVNDQLQKFMFNAAPVRGEIVSLRDTWQEVLTRRSYPTPVRNVLGEMMAACALLSANLKFDGTLIMQIYGDGPVTMLVVQCNSDLSLRATAKLAESIEGASEAPVPITDDMTLPDLLNRNGHGRCVITLDPRDKKPGQQAYQGIVPLSGEHGPLAHQLIANLCGDDAAKWEAAAGAALATLEARKALWDGIVAAIAHEVRGCELTAQGNAHEREVDATRQGDAANCE